MTQCPACEKAKTNPLTGLTKAGCSGCAIRELARSPLYHAGGPGRLRDDYDIELAKIFGTDLHGGHAIVKAERARQRKAVETMT